LTVGKRKWKKFMIVLGNVWKLCFLGQNADMTDILNMVCNIKGFYCKIGIVVIYVDSMEKTVERQF